VADPVSRSGEQGTVSLADAPQEAVVVRVLVSGLEDVVVHILGRLTNRDRIVARLLELEPRQRARRVLEEGLVHFDRDFLARLHPAFDEVRAKEFVRERAAQGKASLPEESTEG
jgi:hypothetical protein